MSYGTTVKIGTIQRRLAWPLRKDDTLNREVSYFFFYIHRRIIINLLKKIFFFFFLLLIGLFDLIFKKKFTDIFIVI
jgi:hypothetical protein